MSHLKVFSIAMLFSCPTYNFYCNSISNCNWKIIDRVSTEEFRRFWSFHHLKLNPKVILLCRLVTLYVHLLCIIYIYKICPQWVKVVNCSL